jgi:hypothetical protein
MSWVVLWRGARAEEKTGDFPVLGSHSRKVFPAVRAQRVPPKVRTLTEPVYLSLAP